MPKEENEEKQKKKSEKGFELLMFGMLLLRPKEICRFIFCQKFVAYKPKYRKGQKNAPNGEKKCMTTE